MPAAPGPSTTLPLRYPTVPLILHGVGVACCLVLAFGPAIATGSPLPVPGLQIGALILALLGAATLIPLLQPNAIGADARGLSLLRPALRLSWDDIALVQVVSVREKRRAALMGAPRWHGNLEICPVDAEAFFAEHPGARRLTGRKAPTILRVNLRERVANARAVDELLRSVRSDAYEGITGDPI